MSRFPDRFIHFRGPDSNEFLTRYNISTITVFVREPISRFLSGLVTQQRLYGFSFNKLIKTWHNIPGQSIAIFDLHTVPQFSFLLRATRPSRLKFQIFDLDRVNEFYPEIGYHNINSKSVKWSQFSPQLQDKIVHFFTEDMVLYNQFQDQTVSLEEILESIKKEKVFTDEYKKYYPLLTYL